MNFRVENVLHHEGEISDSLQKQILDILKDAGAGMQPRGDIVRLHRSKENVSTRQLFYLLYTLVASLLYIFAILYL